MAYSNIFKIIQLAQKISNTQGMQLNITQAGHSDQTFFFEPMPNKFMQAKETKQILTKWGLADTLKIGSFRFNQSFNEFQLDNFIKDLFSSPNIRYIINNLKYMSDTVSQVTFKKLNCTELSTQIFQKLSQQHIVNNDYIAKTYGDTFQGIQISDKLRQCLLMEQSDHYCIFKESQRAELLFKLFQLLVVGGSLNQYQDNLTPYLQWTKNLYKSVVSVRKQAQSSNIFVDSIAVQITKIEKDIFKKDYNPQNVLYVVISASTRVVHVVSNQWVKFW